MTSSRRVMFFLLLLPVMPLTIGCSGSAFSFSSVTVGSSNSFVYPTPTPGYTPTPTPVQQAGKNIMPVTVGNCGTSTYLNEPCVSVTICTPGTSNCQTIPNILLDTGSYGLRVFGSRITVPLTQVTDTSGRNLAECAQFVIGADWGPVKIADVVLGQEAPARVPIQVIDSTFPGLPSDCQNPDVSPEAAGYNGILGVGLFVDDCGQSCVTNANNRVYFVCSGASCSGTTVPIANQVSNPVGLMSQDNNGVILVLPALAAHEASTATGQLLLGVGTQANNSPSGLRTLTTDGNGYINVSFNGTTVGNSFIDSGSNTNAFPAPANLTQCPSSSVAYGFYCPASSMTASATLIGNNGTSVATSFSIGNADTILRTGAKISDQVASTMQGSVDFGLPFFFGKTVVSVISGKSSSLGVGPLWAF